MGKNCRLSIWQTKTAYSKDTEGKIHLQDLSAKDPTFQNARKMAERCFNDMVIDGPKKFRQAGGGESRHKRYD